MHYLNEELHWLLNLFILEWCSIYWYRFVLFFSTFSFRYRLYRSITLADFPKRRVRIRESQPWININNKSRTFFYFFCCGWGDLPHSCLSSATHNHSHWLKICRNVSIVLEIKFFGINFSIQMNVQLGMNWRWFEVASAKSNLISMNMMIICYGYANYK